MGCAARPWSVRLGGSGWCLPACLPEICRARFACSGSSDL
jgi:hypothetical protein